jgi:small subunit ribosomal protein S19
MPKIDKYRGREKDELSKLTLSESLPLMTSRARRTMSRVAGNKGIQVKQLLKKVAAMKDPAKVIRTQVREAVIIPGWLGRTFAVHNGKDWKNVHISVDKLGYRLGDFAHTTSRVLHSGPGVGATRGSKFIPLK